MCLRHNCMRRVLACADDETGLERATGNDERRVSQLTTPNEIHDLHRVAFANQDVRICLALDDVQVVFNGHAARIDVELRQKRGH